nr:MAG: terminase large subunit [Caudoviricetes sp.]
MDLQISKKQKQFISASADEVLFGGAAGGGKSYGQLIDALLTALKYPGSKQLILRRTFPELDKSLIRVALGLYPQEIYQYNSGNHMGKFVNGSLIDFGYCDNENDVFKYQSAEYDVIRFDELTHFTESMYIYLISRLRGANPFPKQVKSSTNPGGVGHQWVKARFIDIGPPDVLHETPTGSRIFIPSKVQDNKFLLSVDPGYLKRLENLSDKDKKALLYGDWDIFEGQFFTEWHREIHICEPFEIPSHWKVYRTLDYGLDMLACYWIGVDEQQRAYVFRELYESNLIISEAAEKIAAMTKEDIYLTLAPPDLWSRRQETGKSVADIFFENGIVLTKTSNSRIDGWLAVKEWIKPFQDEQGVTTSQLRIFPGCVNLIRTLPALQYDLKKPNDTATEPHELTHGPDAIRGFCIYWTTGAEPRKGQKAKWRQDQYEDYYNADASGKEYLLNKWGNPF